MKIINIGGGANFLHAQDTILPTSVLTTVILFMPYFNLVHLKFYTGYKNLFFIFCYIYTNTPKLAPAITLLFCKSLKEEQVPSVVSII